MLDSALTIATLPSPAQCRGLSMIWEKKADFLRLRGRPPSRVSGKFCAVVAAEFDQDWSQQSHPDPAVPPRAHAARARLEQHYRASASDGDMRIDEHRVKLFPVQSTPVELVTAASGAAVATPNPTPIAVPTLASPATPGAVSAPGVAGGASVDTTRADVDTTTAAVATLGAAPTNAVATLWMWAVAAALCLCCGTVIRRTRRKGHANRTNGAKGDPEGNSGAHADSNGSSRIGRSSVAATEDELAGITCAEELEEFSAP